MKILIVLTYYRPHISGLTIYAELLANAFIERGHDVTVLTSRHEKNLPLLEIQNKVRIVRAPVLMRISKGVVMPTFPALVAQLVKEHDVVQLHLPQFDSAVVSLIARVLRKPTIITYHCDLIMPPGLIPWLANQSVLFMNHIAAFFATRLVTYTSDYADHSSFLTKFRHKLEIIPPPVELPEVTQQQIEDYRNKTNPSAKGPVIGMAVRFATEKGIEVILDAMPEILAIFPNAQLQFSGPYKEIRGEEQYIDRLMPRVHQLEKKGSWLFLGPQSHEEMALFYPNIDVLILPSLNATEAFGLVQIEAMISGTPSVASALPGVRQPVLRHKMGEVVAIGDSKALAQAIIKIFNQPASYQQDSQQIRSTYLPEKIATRYEQLVKEIVA